MSSIIRNTQYVFAVAFVASLVFIVSCKQDEPAPNLKQGAVETYADIVLATYEDAYATAVDLQSKINAFIATPSEAGLEACRAAWKKARDPYSQSEAFRFYGGPIDDENGPEGHMNAWPVDESFIDYTADNTMSGIINMPNDYPTITKDLLADLNESTSETSISTGYHAIEYLLWGQDFYVDSPGKRPYTDFITGDGGTASNQARRGQYLKAATELLIDNLGYVRDAWKSGSTYRTQFVGNSNDAIENIFTGVGELSKGEMGGERMFVAVDTQDQENEQSCFSDNSLADFKMDLLGIKNVYTGSYTGVNGSVISGTSFDEALRAIDPAKANAVKNTLANAEQKINAIPDPFDQAILNNGEVILAARDALNALSDALADASLALKK